MSCDLERVKSRLPIAMSRIPLVNTIGRSSVQVTHDTSLGVDSDNRLRGITRFRRRFTSLATTSIATKHRQ